jgi:hypothetical protein
MKAGRHTAAAFSLAMAATLLAFAMPAAAQDKITTDEDALFGGDEVVETVTESAEGSAVQGLLVTKAVRVGGSFTGTATGSWQWDNPWTDGLDPIAPDSYGLVPRLSGLVFFDGRPTEDSRFYGSVKSSWPFSDQTSVLTGANYVVIDPDFDPPPTFSTTSTTLTIPDIEVFELFSDFSWNDSLYMRFGKQTVNWGVGYFFSPANIMNLEVIDPTDPTVQLEGPVALRAMYAIPKTQHNLWAYAVFDSETMKPEDTALAAKAEFVLGGLELGLGGYYQRESPVRAMLTAVGSVRDISLFGEATAQLGTDRTWVTSVSAATPGFVTTTDTDDYDGTVFLKGTVGFSYRNTDKNITLMGQYLYDGEGYANADRKARIAEAKAEEPAIKFAIATLDPTADADAAFSLFLKRLILNSGRHYAAFTFAKSELLTEQLGFSAFVIANLSDFSGYLKPTLSWDFFDGLSLSASVMFALGFEDGEYVVLNDGQALGLSLVLTMGTGSF